jgi:hypothetical protein
MVLALKEKMEIAIQNSRPWRARLKIGSSVKTPRIIAAVMASKRPRFLNFQRSTAVVATIHATTSRQPPCEYKQNISERVVLWFGRIMFE